jgi:hypothetical protein
MLEEVQGKPVRGILSCVQFSPITGKCYATLESPDFCQGEEGRNELTQGKPIHTSTVRSFDVVEGQLVIVTEYSAYIIEGTIDVMAPATTKSEGL